MDKRRFGWSAAAACLALCGVAWGQAPAKPGVAAQIGDEVITLEELDAKALSTNMKLAQSLYDARKAVLDQIVMERVLAKEAKEKGISADELLKQRTAEKMKPITDADVEAYYNANKARMGTQPFEQIKEAVRGRLQAQQENEARQALLKELKAEANVKVALEAPRIKVAVSPNAPTKGPASAPVTIVEVSDFQ